MGILLSPVVADFYMELFEKTAIQSASIKPSCWFYYVHDTFVMWNHGKATVADFLAHLNNVHPRIQFTIEKEKNFQLAILDVLVTRKKDGTLGHSVYRKPTHTFKKTLTSVPARSVWL